VKREDLEHVIRAAAAITDEKIFVVIGSQAILAQHPNAPEILRRSPEADLYPANRPELADVIEGAIGIDSPFHRTFGYYVEAVGPETAKLPSGWEARAVRLSGPATGGATALCPEANDLAASKLVAGRPKDLEWLAAALTAKLIDKDRLAQLLRTAPVDDSVRELAAKRLAAMRE
jgi:hypothetical protein